MGNERKVVLGGGCFWGVEEYYRRLLGVISTRVGYAQGNVDYPTYEEVKRQLTHHREVVEIVYDASLISLSSLLDHLFRMIDPTVQNRQGNDIGESYQAGMYYETEEDKAVMEAFIQKMQPKYKNDIVVEVDRLKQFWEAETYHQMYLVKNPMGYCHVDFSKILPHELKIKK